jgi:hypothetical protein
MRQASTSAFSSARTKNLIRLNIDYKNNLEFKSRYVVSSTARDIFDQKSLIQRWIETERIDRRGNLLNGEVVFFKSTCRSRFTV